MENRKDYHKTGTLRGAMRRFGVLQGERGLRGAIFAGLLLCGAGVIALTGCTKEPAAGPDAPKGGVVTVAFEAPAIGEPAAAQAQNAARNASALPATRAALAENTTVRVVAFTAATGNPAQANYMNEQTYYVSGGSLLPCTVNADGSFAAAPTAKMELEPGSYDFYAITPALPLNADKATVSVANGVDYAASATKGVTVDNPMTCTLTELDRKCVKVTFVVKKADDYSEMSALSVTTSGTGLTLMFMPAAQSATLGADIPAAAGATSFTVPPSSFSLSGTTSTSTPVVLLPRATDEINFSYDLSYTFSDNSIRDPAVGGTIFDLTMEKGRSYTLTLTMLKSGDASLSVNGWTDNNWSADMGEEVAYPCILEGKYIVSADMFGSSGEPLHPNWTAATMPVHNETSGDNALAAKFEVAAADCNSTNAPSVTQTSNQYTWANALLACSKYTQSGSSADQWRLPTLKELQLIYPKKSELTGVGSFANERYWSATEDSSDSYYAWIVTFNSGISVNPDKDSDRNVRYVRDI